MSQREELAEPVMDKPIVFVKVDEEGGIRQTGTIFYPDRTATDVWKELSGLVEAEGCRVIRFQSEEDLPEPGSTWDGKRWHDPKPTSDLHADLRAKAEKVAAGQASWTPEERDRVTALRLLGEL